jgi:hypothetical protein
MPAKIRLSTGIKGTTNASAWFRFVALTLPAWEPLVQESLSSLPRRNVEPGGEVGR